MVQVWGHRVDTHYSREDTHYSNDQHASKQLRLFASSEHEASDCLVAFKWMLCYETRQLWSNYSDYRFVGCHKCHVSLLTQRLYSRPANCPKLSLRLLPKDDKFSIHWQCFSIINCGIFVYQKNFAEADVPGRSESTRTEMDPWETTWSRLISCSKSRRKMSQKFDSLLEDSGRTKPRRPLSPCLFSQGSTGGSNLLALIFVSLFVCRRTRQN